MLDRSRSLILAALLLAAAAPVARAADSPLPVQTPDLPATPSVAVTPGDGGVTVDAGAGDTGVQLGVGKGGVTLGLRPRGGTTPGTSNGGGGDGGARVGTPAFPAPARGSGPVGFGQGELSVGGAGSASGSTGAARRSDKGGARRAQAAAARRGARKVPAQPVKQSSSRQPPFFELVDRIPTAFRIALLALALIALAVWAAWVRARRRLDANAYVDPTTGIANAVAFERILDAELERAKRYKRPLGILLLDVSEAGSGRRLGLRDQSLREASGALGERLREADKSARLGPSRFAVVSPEATAASVETLGRAVGQRLEKLRIRTVVGVADRQPADRSGADLLARAEADLREAHGAGGEGGGAATEAEAAERRRALRAA